MQPELILKSDVLDILFENRNKEYGAYMLRREYDGNMRKAILITFSLAALLLLLAFSFKQKNSVISQPAIIDMVNKPMPPFEKKKAEQPQKHKNILPKKTMQLVAAIKLPTKTTIVQDNLADTKIAKVDEVLKSNIAAIKTNGIDGIAQQNINDGDGDVGKQTLTGTNGDNAGNTTTDHPDVYPEFPGGQQALLNFLRKNLTNPSDLEAGQKVSVRIRFVVKADGSIADFSVIESGGDAFDNEVLRVLKKMPHWIPGKSNGHDVSVYFEVPVKFIADDSE